MAELRRSSITVDGLRSPLIESGPEGAAEAVVFTHGSPGCAAEFERLLERTGEFARAVALDMPGFGQADKPRPGDFTYDVASIGAHLSKQLDELGVERAHFVGHDFGGGWNLIAAGIGPDRVASFALINTGFMPGYRWHRVARIYRTRGLGEAFMAVANERAFKRVLRDLPERDVDLMWRNFDRDSRRAILALYRATDQTADEASAAELAKFTADWPVTVIFGARDPYIPVRFAAGNKQAFPRAELHTIDEAGHWPHLETPERLEGLLLPFLREQSRAGAAL